MPSQSAIFNLMQKGNILVGILIGLAVAGGLFGAYYLGTRNNKPHPQNPIITSTPQPLTSPSPSSDEAANWKTYTNKKYGFSIKYPQDWYSYTGYAWNDNPKDNFSHVDLSPDTPPQGMGSGRPTGVRIFVGDKATDSSFNTDNLNVYNYAKKVAIDPNSVRYDTINGVQIVRTSGEPSAGNGGPSVFIAKNDVIIDIGAESMDEKAFNQILSTFKFTN